MAKMRTCKKEVISKRKNAHGDILVKREEGKGGYHKEGKGKNHVCWMNKRI
jgi:hypothetical protein